MNGDALKILMLNPPFLPKFSRSSRSPAKAKGGTLYYPIWLAYAAGVLEREGFDVRLVDAPARGLGHNDVVNEAKKFKPDMAVLDTSTPSISNDIAVAEKIKDATKCFTVLVGTHVSALPEQVLEQSKKIDAIARREYDYTLPELADAVENERSLKKIGGISFRENGKIFHNPDRGLIQNLDELPFVSEVYKRHLNIRDYFYAANLYPEVTILSGRGCPYRCVFCLLPQTMTGRGYRFRSAKNVADEFEFIRNEFPEVREIFIEDDTMTANRDRCREISKMLIERKIKITWSCNSRADVDLETMKIMKRAGCRLFCVGIESGSQEVLDKIHKGTRIETIRNFMADAKKSGVLVHGCFMLGVPGDTRKTIKKTIEFAKELNPDTAQFFPIMVYPGTEAYSWAKENNYLLTEDYSRWLTPEGLHNCVISRPDLSDKELVMLADEARREFYMRPSYIVSKIKQSVLNPREIPRILKASKTFFRYLKRGTFGEKS